MNEDRGRQLLLGLVVVLLVGIGFIQTAIDPDLIKIRKAENPDPQAKKTELMVQLPSQFLVASMTGFKEVVAGALWVRADEFFHSNQYQAIVPIVRLVTWLDPHNIDVYTTGAWHLDYNFVDKNQLSDKRYIPCSIALLKEGIRNNPNIWDLYFELGWTHYNKKLQDFEQGLKYLELAVEHDGFDPSSGRRVPHPEFVDNMLAHQYAKLGKYDDAVTAWANARKNVLKSMEREKAQGFVDQTSLDVVDKNLALLHLRQAWRYGDMDAYRKGVEISTRLAKRGAMLPWAAEYAEKDYKQRLATNNPPQDTKKPVNTGFEVTVQKVAPKVLRIKGKLNLMQTSEYKDLVSEGFTRRYAENMSRKKLWEDGCRVQWRLTDYGYKTPNMDEFDWKIDTDQTVAWGDLYVRNGVFSEELAFNVSDEFYPFKADKYLLTLWVTPMEFGMPDMMQDRIGWRGEGITDKPELIDKTSQPGFTRLKWEKVLTRGDIL